MMKHFFTSLAIAFALAAVQPVFGQEAKDSALWPNGIAAKVLFIDYGIANGNSDLDFSNGIEITYLRNLSPKFNFGLPLKVGLANITTNDIKETFFGIDAIGQFQFFKPENKFVPYLMGGGGITYIKDDGTNVQFPVGLGFNYKVNQGGYITAQLEYRKSLEDGYDNLQLGIGWHFRVGYDPNLKDTDGDGIIDSEDACVDVPGVKSANGCPDDDRDGIRNEMDECPKDAGPKELMGCPDKDGDGIPDHKDECPEVPGIEENAGCPEVPKDSDGDGVIDDEDDCPNVAGTIRGCPDTDGDGVIDKEDDCPSVKGVPALNGCPDADGDGVTDKDDMCPTIAGEFSGCPDTDGDGTHDGIDKCITLKGPGSNDGCPDIKVEDQERLDYAAKAVQFETGKAVLRPDSYRNLNEIADILKRYPRYRLKISGHTDNVGDKESNQKLSEERAKACYDYFLGQGISKSKLSYIGYGEDRPIANNRRAEGRRLNRRTEFELIYQ